MECLQHNHWLRCILRQKYAAAPCNGHIRARTDPMVVVDPDRLQRRHAWHSAGSDRPPDQELERAAQF